MKKVISSFVFTCLILPSLVHAKNPGCEETVFSIQNQSSNDCILKEFKILKGSMFEQSQIPEVVFHGQTVDFSVTLSQDNRRSALDYRYSSDASVMLYLNYQCGNNQSINLLSQVSPEIYCSMGGKKSSIEGFILNKNNLDATFEKTDNTLCSAWSKTPPSKISWTLTDS